MRHHVCRLFAFFSFTWDMLYIVFFFCCIYVFFLKKTYLLVGGRSFCCSCILIKVVNDLREKEPYFKLLFFSQKKMTNFVVFLLKLTRNLGNQTLPRFLVELIKPILWEIPQNLFVFNFSFFLSFSLFH